MWSKEEMSNPRLIICTQRQLYQEVAIKSLEGSSVEQQQCYLISESTMIDPRWTIVKSGF